MKPRRMLPPVERFLSKITIENRGYKTPCWIFNGSTRRGGYAQFYTGGRQTNRGRMLCAHVWSYTHFVGPIPEGLVLDHLCRVHECANPYHVEPVTVRENNLRGEGFAAKWSARTHCEYGHEYTQENTYTTKEGARKCRKCNARMGREHRQRAREKGKVTTVNHRTRYGA